MHAPQRIKGFVGGRGAGKTWVNAYHLLRRAKPNRHYAFVSPIYPDVKDVTLPTFQLVARKIGRRIKINRSDFRGEFQTDGGDRAFITFRSALDYDSLRGPSFSGVALDEASLIVEEAYRILVGTLREAGEPGWLAATFTPKGKSHWTYRVFGEQHDADVALVRAGTSDNPHAPAELVADLEKAYAGTALAEQEIGGAFVDWQGTLLKWEHIIACSDQDCLWRGQPRMHGDLFLGVDIGRNRDKTVLWTWEKIGDVCWAREILVLDRVAFAEQEQEIRRRLGERRMVKAAIDAGAIGAPIAESLARDFPHLVVPVAMTRANQVRLAELFRAGFERRGVRIPPDAKLREDLQLVRLAADNSIETGRDSQLGHADRFWAGALGYEVASFAAPPPRVARPAFVR